MNLEGNIGEIDLIGRLVELWRERFTGAIRFENDGIIKILYFKNGDILSASTNDRSDSIDEILMRAGKVSRDHVKQALAKRKENETLGDALLNLGFITRKELSWARRVQVVGVIRSIAAWNVGSFTIVADYLPKRDEGTLFALPQILVELVVTEQDRARFESAMNGGDLVLEKSEIFDSVFPTLGLNEDADAIAGALDGVRNAREIANVSGRDTFNVYKLLRALAILGVVRESTGPKVTPEVSSEEFLDFGTPAAEPSQEWSDWGATSNPTFDLDDTTDAPAIDLNPIPEASDSPLQFESEAVPAPEPPPAITWDDTPAWESPAPPSRLAEPEPLEQPPAKTVAWDAPARESLGVPIQVPIEPAADADEEQWGFDEAQLETSRRAIPSPAAAGNRQPARGGRRYGLIVAVLAVLILAAAAYGGWMWWSARQEAPAEVVEQPRPRPVAPAATATTPATDTTATIVDVSTATVAETPGVTPAGSSTAPRQEALSAEPVTEAPVAAPAPAATPERQRLDAMAREFAANPTGNYTIQIQILCDPGNLGQAMKTGGTNLWFVPQPIGTRSCYRVFWGRFNTDREASAAMASIPRALRDPNAAVKPVPRG